uniref:Uncharacterized protein n=1 Tax=Anguilla anguilla TaxID=7936 RepID=A0A0E9RPG4_ANGAN
MFTIAEVFLRSSFTPSAETTSLTKVNLFTPNSHLYLFNFRFTFVVISSTCLSWVSCSSLVDPQMMMSSIMASTPGMCSKIMCIVLW